MQKKKETTIDMLARNIALLHGDMKNGFDTVNKEINELKQDMQQVKKDIKDIDFKIDKIGFNHGRRLDVIEDDLSQIKTVLIKNKILK